MSERNFRFLIGCWLVAAQLLGWSQAVLGLALLILAEGVTNWRVPVLVSRVLGRPAPATCEDRPWGRRPLVPFEAERALRLIVASLLLCALGFPDLLWWLPWFVGFAMVGAGLSGICPMVLGLRWLGLQ